MMSEEQATVLIVDDAAMMRQLFKDILRKSPFEVIGETANGQEALKLYADLRPDLVLMDVMMPGLDGIEVTRAIMGQDPRARIIICTTVSQKSRVMEALRAGAKDFIVKPLVPRKVLEAMRKVLAR